MGSSRPILPRQAATGCIRLFFLVPMLASAGASALTPAPERTNVRAATSGQNPTRAAKPPAASFVAPPRTISDIAAILDAEQPDRKKIEQLKAAADRKSPANASPAALSDFYYDRGNARYLLGRSKDAIDDADKAIEVGRGAVDAANLGRLQQFAGLQYLFAGNPKRALAIFEAQIRDTAEARGHAFNGYRVMSSIVIQMGDLARAEAYLRRNLALIREARTWPKYAQIGPTWEAEIDYHRAIIAEARGQFREAEALYRSAAHKRGSALQAVLTQKYHPPETQIRQSIDFMVLSEARMKAKQGRLAEAEVDARRALLATLRNQGKYHFGTPVFIMGLATILVEQGRYQEAEKLARTCIDIYRTVGVAPQASNHAGLLANLATILNYQRKNEEAIAVYAELEKAIASWEPQRRQRFELDSSRIYSLYSAGQIQQGIDAAQALLKRELSRVGETHFDTAVARGFVAIGYMRARKDWDAVREFKMAMPILISAARENTDADNTVLVAARTDRLRYIAEAYIVLLGRMQPGSAGVAIETFQLADAIRAQSVQQALSASSARMVAKDPALAELIRAEQDLVKQINAQLGMLNNALTLPSSERDEAGVRAINASIEKARADRNKARADIARRFPRYTDLVEPKAPSVDEIRTALRPGEALVSFYFGAERSFVWAVPKEGPVAFAVVDATAGELEGKVRELREALEPAAIRTIDDMPQFDVDLGYAIYRLLLEPVESGWKRANSLIVVTNGALGLLPLSLLPTAPSAGREDGGIPFAHYRKVPWLVRSHAVTVVPSAAALKTLRQLPLGSDKRQPLVGFGDPYFSAEHAVESEE